MKLHILGICGTFMGGLALIAREQGHQVSGSDQNVYPPMSTQLEKHGIALIDGYGPEQLDPAPDQVIVGNTLTRGNACVEYLLNKQIPFTSGAQWLYQNVLQGKHVLAVSGTHGKTTTSAMLAWILEVEGLKPGYLIGGVPANFMGSARLGNGTHFVIEGDEYDTAFFDKRSKFIHYRPTTLIINNIEYDHADIFNDIAAIRREFHHLIRTIPDHGLVIAKQGDGEIQKLLDMGCWSPVEFFGDEDVRWIAKPLSDDFSEFELAIDDVPGGIIHWDMIGQHNAYNAMAAIAAANHIGVPTGTSCEALANFKGVKRRLEQLADINGVKVYDDFAHHPTEIRSTLAGLRLHVGNKRILVIMEPRSNSMRRGTHKETLAPAFREADRVFLYQPEDLSWDLAEATQSLGEKCRVFIDIDQIVTTVIDESRKDDHIVIMSNGGFGGIHHKIINTLESRC